MAAPLSGVGQQQVPLSQPFQPGGTDQTREVRQQNQNPREEELQVREAPAAQSQEVSEDTNFQRDAFQEALGAQSSSNPDNSQGRGSVVDIVI